MRSMPRQHSAAASQASGVAERALGSWVQGVGKLADRFPVLLPQVDLITAVERYFDFLQRAMEMNRSIAVQWAVAVSMLSGVARKRAESAGEVVRARSESFERPVGGQAEKTEQAEQELAREARRIEREKARQANHPTCQVPLQY